MTTTEGVHGRCDSRFHALREEFERNFRERGEVVASVCVTLGGETVVDLWGGKVRADAEDPWEEFATGTGLTAARMCSSERSVHPGPT